MQQKQEPKVIIQTTVQHVDKGKLDTGYKHEHFLVSMLNKLLVGFIFAQANYVLFQQQFSITLQLNIKSTN